MATVAKDQFSWVGDRLTHQPTGATFHFNSEFVNYGRAGEALTDGSCYEREDVLEVAHNVVLAERARREGRSN